MVRTNVMMVIINVKSQRNNGIKTTLTENGCHFFWYKSNLPLSDSTFLRVKVDAYFHYGQSAVGKLRLVILQVDLLHGCFRTLVQFQFKQAQGISSDLCAPRCLVCRACSC